MKKQLKIVHVLSDTNIKFFLSGSFVNFVSECNRLLESIPEEYRPATEIGCYRYNEDEFCAEIYYCREETDEEVEIRVKAEKDRENAIRAKELQMLAELKAKYESSDYAWVPDFPEQTKRG